MTDSPEFRAILDAEAAESLNPEQRELLVRFREEVLRENEVQNLTRQLSPRDFFDGHVRDVLELQRSGFLGPTALDLGAGMGVPGFVSALLYREPEATRWISCDSEAHKADFVARMAQLFEVNRFESLYMRAEDLLKKASVQCVVSRAVGPVSRIYGWIGNCSTWNSLILMKGPKWEEEWKDFQRTSQRKKLRLRGEHRYEVGADRKSRVIVALDRA